MTPEGRRSTRIAGKLIPALTAVYLESGDSRLLDRLMASAEQEGQKERLVDSAGEVIAMERDLDAARAFLGRFVPEGDSAALDARMLSFLAGAERVSFAIRADWIVGHLDPQAAAEMIRQIIGEQMERGDDPVEWIRAQPSGIVKDNAHAIRSGMIAFTKGHKLGLEVANQIGDPALRAKTRREIAAGWLREFPDAARRELPADLLPEGGR
jgi:hypothetical protein